LLPAISMIVVMYRNRRTGIRRVLQISEILKNSKPNVLMQLDMKSDKLGQANKSQRLMNELMLNTGLSQKEINIELKEKMDILKWLAKKKVNKINDIGKVVATYYTNKDIIMNFIRKNVS
ncbi:hypothetical protein K8R47_01555, partial [archaeon]|nr:hypothetical protein [archaeon]